MGMEGKEKKWGGVRGVFIVEGVVAKVWFWWRVRCGR